MSRPLVRYGLGVLAGSLAVYPLASVGAVLLPPDPLTQLLAAVPVLVGGVAFGAWYVRSGRPVRLLGRFVVVLYVVEWMALAAAFVLVAVVGLPLVGPAALPALALLVLGGYVAAFWLVYRDGYARLRGRIRHPLQ